MARHKKSLSTDLIETGVTAGPSTPSPAPDSFIRDMAFHPNIKQAAEIVAAHYDQVWLAAHGTELEQVQRKIEAASDALEAMNSCRRGFFAALLNTARFTHREPPASTQEESA